MFVCFSPFLLDEEYLYRRGKTCHQYIHHNIIISQTQRKYLCFMLFALAFLIQPFEQKTPVSAEQQKEEKSKQIKYHQVLGKEFTQPGDPLLRTLHTTENTLVTLVCAVKWNEHLFVHRTYCSLIPAESFPLRGGSGQNLEKRSRGIRQRNYNLGLVDVV